MPVSFIAHPVQVIVVPLIEYSVAHRRGGVHLDSLLLACLFNVRRTSSLRRGLVLCQILNGIGIVTVIAGEIEVIVGWHEAVILSELSNISTELQ